MRWIYVYLLATGCTPEEAREKIARKFRLSLTEAEEWAGIEEAAAAPADEIEPEHADGRTLRR